MNVRGIIYKCKVCVTSWLSLGDGMARNIREPLPVVIV